MKKQLLAIVIAAVGTMVCASNAFARSNDVWVDGYTRSDGTPVRGHYRSAPDNSYNNNWFTEGNTNPYTGNEGTNPRRGY